MHIHADAPAGVTTAARPYSTETKMTVVFITKNNARDAKTGENKSWFNGEPVSDTAKKPPPAARERYQNEKKGSFPSCRKVHKVKKCSSCHSSNQS